MGIFDFLFKPKPKDPSHSPASSPAPSGGKTEPHGVEFDWLLSERDAGKSPTEPPVNVGVTAGEAAAAAPQLGVITLLLEKPLPEGALAQCDDLVMTYAERDSFPREKLDTRDVPEDFDCGVAFLSLGTDVPGAGDPWAVDGTLRRISRVVRGLAEHATGVVLHHAGGLVMPARSFVGLLGDLDDPECRPFAAWLDFGIGKVHDEAVYRTFGMGVFGLPDVYAPVHAKDAWSIARRHEAVFFACHRMVHEHRALDEGETLRVSLRTRVGAWPMKQDEEGCACTYRAMPDDAGKLKLEVVEDMDPAPQWEELREGIGLPAYQALFEHALEKAIPSTHIEEVPSSDPDALPHAVEIRARKDGRGFLLVTNGIGRQCQFEVAAWAPAPSRDLAHWIGELASHAHAHASRPGASGWKPGDTLNAPLDDLGIGGFVLADGGVFDMGPGPRVGLLLLVPLSPEEYQSVRGGGGAAWLSTNDVDEHRWAQFSPSVA